MNTFKCGKDMGTRRPIPRSRLGVCYLLGAVSAISGCLDRPLSGTHPETQSIFVKRNETKKIDKIDVLFMIDNSLSMADKQAVLSAAVPQLLRRLTTPYCVDPENPEAEPEVTDTPTAPCKTPNYVREFSAVNDIHIGIITSSLGSNGGDVCLAEQKTNAGVIATPSQNDHGWLLGSLSRTEGKLQSYLSWSAQDANQYATQIDARESEFRSFVNAAGEDGCGIEMSLESWYRFLVDPAPAKDVTLAIEGNRGRTQRSTEIDNDLLSQRAAFLRPDSLLAIVMLSDENDCSLKDTGASFWLTKSRTKDNETVYPKGAAGICKTDPNNRCCYSCDINTPPEGCPADPACVQPETADEPKTGLVCFETKRRYGYDFLFPTSRYVNALKLPWICPQNDDLDCTCNDGKTAGCTPIPEDQRQRNPLYPDPQLLPVGVEARMKPDMVFLTGIVGVPWQDVATKKSWQPTQPGQAESSLKYLPSSQIDWTLILPDNLGNPARDPLMREQIEPRSGLHPNTGEAIGTTNLDAPAKVNQINFHDWIIPSAQDLQYACVFDLSQPISDIPNPSGLPGAARDCGPNATHTGGCACAKGEKSPLCLDPKTNQYGNIQYAAKAYPATRQLEVLKGHNDTAADNSIVASICPKDLNWDHRNQPGYGYNPALASLVERLKSKLVDNCVGRALAPDPDGSVNCAIIEATQSPEWSSCDAKKRSIVAAELDAAVRRQMKADGICPDNTCSGFSLCELPQLSKGDALQKQYVNDCQNTPGFETSSPVPGYCYVDPEQGIGNASIVATCPVGQKRKIRIVGDGAELRAPAPGWTYIACSVTSAEGTKNATITTAPVQ